MTADIGHAQTVCAVCRDEHLLVRTDDACQHGFHTECAVALHEHSGVLRCGYMAEKQQPVADTAGNLLVIIIPGTVVEQHPLLDRHGRGKRSRREQFIFHN
jgi:hypothetical protein